MPCHQRLWCSHEQAGWRVGWARRCAVRSATHPPYPLKPAPMGPRANRSCRRMCPSPTSNAAPCATGPSSRGVPIAWPLRALPPVPPQNKRQGSPAPATGTSAQEAGDDLVDTDQPCKKQSPSAIAKRPASPGQKSRTPNRAPSSVVAHPMASRPKAHRSCAAPRPPPTRIPTHHRCAVARRIRRRRHRRSHQQASLPWPRHPRHPRLQPIHPHQWARIRARFLPHPPQ
jgi:hypothetical protein